MARTRCSKTSGRLKQKQIPRRKQSLILLLIESGRRTAGAVKKSLARLKGIKIQIIQEYTLQQGMKRLEQGGVDIILLDLFLPDSGGLETFSNLAVKAGKIPIVVMVDKEDRSVALEAVRRGAQDYVVKGLIRGELLFHVLRGAMTRQRSEEQLFQTTVELSALFRAFPDLSLRLAQDGVILDYNAGPSGEVFALPPEFVGKPMREVFPPSVSQMLEKALAEVKQKKTIVSVEYPLRKKGTEKWFEARLLPLVDNDFMMVIRDITERIRLEKLRDDFVSTVSHELRTPLTIMKEAVLQVTAGFLGELNREQKETLETALEGVDRLRRLIDDLLDLSKLEAGRMPVYREKLELTEIAEEVTKSFLPQAKSKGIELTCSGSGKSAFIYGDRDKLVQVFVNLIGNALKFTSAGFVKVNVAGLEEVVECRVEDSGIGIAKEDLPKVFDKFQQFVRNTDPREKSTGLGLSLTKGLVEMHDGKIWVESEFERGCRFTFRIPVYSSLEILRQHLLERVKEVARDESYLLSARLWVRNFDGLKNLKDVDGLLALGGMLEKFAKETLRRKGDVAVGIRPEDRSFDKDALNIWFIFPQAQKKDGVSIMDRVLNHVKGSLAKHAAEPAVELEYVMAAYPEDGRSADELIEKLLALAYAR